MPISHWEDAGRDRTRARVSYWASLLRLSRPALLSADATERGAQVGCEARRVHNVGLALPQRAFFAVRPYPEVKTATGWPPSPGEPVGIEYPTLRERKGKFFQGNPEKIPELTSYSQPLTGFPPKRD